MATSTGRSVTRSKESGQQRTNGRSVTTASFAPARRNADFRSTPGDSGRLSRAWNCVIFIVVLLCCFHSSQLSQPGTAGPVKFEGGTNEGAAFRRIPNGSPDNQATDPVHPNRKPGTRVCRNDLPTRRHAEESS